EPQLTSVGLQVVDDSVPDPLVQPLGQHREGAHLTEVLPHDVQRAASENGAVVGLSDTELLDRLEQHDSVFAEEDAPLHERLHELADRPDVCGAGTPNEERHPSMLAPHHTPSLRMP